MANKIITSFFYTLLLLTCFTLAAIPANAAKTEEAIQEPAIEIVGSGPVVPQSATQSIPVSFRNLTHVDVEILKLTDPQRLLTSYYLMDGLSAYRLDQLKHSFKSVFSDRFQLPEGKANQFNSAQLPIPQSLKAGWYFVVLKIPGTFENYRIKHMLLTDLGIQVRVLKNETNIYVTRLSDGSALSDMTVTVHGDDEPISQTTDKHGWASFKQKFNRNNIIVATSKNGADYGVLPMREVPLDLSEYKIGGKKHQLYETYIYSNRDLVKPGESLPLNILTRDQDGNAVSNLTLTLEVLNPRGDVVYCADLSPTNTGYASTTIQTATDWPTGRYTAQVSLFEENKVGLSELKFQVEEFVPERMDLIFSENKPWIPLDGVNEIKVEGRYLFGSPASGNELTLCTLTTPVRHFTSGPNKAFIVGKEFSLSGAYKYQESAEVLSDEGTLTLSVSPPSLNDVSYKSPVNVTVNMSLLESGGAAVQRTLTFNSWLNKNIPGILPASSTFEYDSFAEFDIALLSPDGQKLVDGDLEIELLYDRGPRYWTYEEGVGWTSHKQERWVSILTRTVSVKNRAKRLSLPVSWGDYNLIVKDKKTGLETNYEFYAGWYRGSTQLKSKPDHLVIKTDKPAYKAGDTVKVLLSAPINGQVALTLDSADKNIWRGSRYVKKGSVEIELPVAVGDLSRHDLYLTTTLTGKKGSTPKRYLGVQHLKLDRSDRKLGVSATLPNLIEPMTKLTIPVAVSNIAESEQSNTWVTVSIVDKGIINLSRYYPTNPFNYLFGKRRYEGDIIDLFSRQYDNRPNPFARSRFGSDGNDTTSNKNDGLVESKTIILMSKAVNLKNGKANIEFEIPDYNGEGQVIVTAFNGTQVGQLVKNNTISSKIITELSVPRFFVPGDKSTVTVDLFNCSGEKQDFDLGLVSSTGLTIDSGSLPQKITLNDGEHWSKSLFVFVDKKAKYPQVTLNILLNNQNFAYDRSWKVPVKPVEPWTTQGKVIFLSPNEQYVVPASLWHGLETIDGKMGTAQINIAPVLSVTEHAKDLLRYPYGCAEQTTSKAWPFLLQHPALTVLKQKSIARRNHNNSYDDEIREIIASAIARLKTMQLETGGFSLWSGGERERPWLTVYITEFLLEANRTYSDVVPENMLNNASNRLHQYVEEIKDLEVDKYDRQKKAATAAYAAYILSQQGKLQYSTLGEFKLQYPTSLTSLYYVYAYTEVTGKTKEAEAYLDDLLTSPATSRPEYFYSDYGSVLRDLSNAVLVLEKISEFPKLKDKALTLQGIFLERIQKKVTLRRWLSTQERGALLQAAILSQRKSSQGEVTVLINKNKRTNKGQINIPLAQGITLQNPTNAPLYIKVLAEGYLKIDPEVDGSNSPFNTIRLKGITRTLTKLGAPKASNKLTQKGNESWFKELKKKLLPEEEASTVYQVGDRILVTLQVTSKYEWIPNALLVDRIPAGFVLENPALNQGVPIKELLPKETAETLHKPTYVEYRNDRFVASDDLNRRSETYTYAYVLRAEVPGTFIVPPVFIESMYSPEQHGIYWQTPRYITIKR